MSSPETPVESQEQKSDPLYNFGDPRRGKWERRGGAKTDAEWAESCLFHIRPYAKRLGWESHRIPYHVAVLMRRVALSDNRVRRVLSVWDGYGTRARFRVFSMDMAIKKADVIDPIEFGKLALRELRAYLRAEAMAEQDISMPEMVAASVKSALSLTKEGSTERIRHLERADIIDKPKAAVTQVVTQVNNAPPRTFDAQMQELDNVIEGEVLGETKLIGDGSNDNE